jgi:hypothetical protein
MSAVIQIGECTVLFNGREYCKDSSLDPIGTERQFYYRNAECGFKHRLCLDETSDSIKVQYAINDEKYRFDVWMVEDIFSIKRQTRDTVAKHPVAKHLDFFSGFYIIKRFAVL